MIDLKNIYKFFQSGKEKVIALNGISISFDKNEFVCITGESGSGKTTLLNIIGLIEKPSKGDYFFKNRSINTFSDRKLTLYRKNSIGIVFQNFSLIPNLTVFENVFYPLLFSKTSFIERKNRVLKILEELKIDSLKDRFPKELSGGEKQRVAIARAIIHQPSLLIADEPTANLDSKNSKNIINIFKEITEKFNITCIIASHNNIVVNNVKRIIVLKDGRIEDEKFN